MRVVRAGVCYKTSDRRFLLRLINIQTLNLTSLPRATATAAAAARGRSPRARPEQCDQTVKNIGGDSRSVVLYC